MTTNQAIAAIRAEAEQLKEHYAIWTKHREPGRTLEYIATCAEDIPAFQRAGKTKDVQRLLATAAAACLLLLEESDG